MSTLFIENILLLKFWHITRSGRRTWIRLTSEHIYLSSFESRIPVPMATSKPNLKSSPAEIQLKLIQPDSNIRHHRSQPSSSSTQTGQTTASSSLQPADQTADKDNLPHHSILSSGNIEHAQPVPSKEALGVFATADSQRSRAVDPSTTTVLRSRFRQKSTSLGLSVLAIILLTFSTWFIYIEFVSEKAAPTSRAFGISHHFYSDGPLPCKYIPGSAVSRAIPQSSPLVSRFKITRGVCSFFSFFGWRDQHRRPS
jgi:hypothetical protein